MIETITPYTTTALCFLAMGGLLLVQLLVADVAGLVKGHVPGSALTTSHESFHFRSTRAFANTNESLLAFVLLAACGIAFEASVYWVNTLSLAYVGSRVAHMLLYWLGFGPLRSVAFVVCLAAMIGLLIVDIAAVTG